MIWRTFLPPLAYKTLLTVLTVTRIAGAQTRAPVVMRLFFDGTLYYIVVVAVLSVTAVGAAYPSVSLDTPLRCVAAYSPCAPRHDQ